MSDSIKAINNTYYRRKAANLCTYCGRKLQDDIVTTRCDECAKRIAKKQKSRRDNAIVDGLCTDCGASAEQGMRRCSRCLEKNCRIQREKRAQWKANGKCYQCGSPHLIQDTFFCERCYLKMVSRRNLGTNYHWEKLKEKLELQCFTCPYTGEKLVLGKNASLDHIYPAFHYPDLANDPNNVEWVTKEINEMKRDRTPQEFLDLIQCILDHIRT